MLCIVVVESEQENGGLAVLNLRVGQLLGYASRELTPAQPLCYLFYLMTAIPLTLTLESSA